MILLSIDPGADTGWAVSRDGWIISCGIVHPAKGQRIPVPPTVPNRVVSELPEDWHGRGKKKASVADLITLSNRLGRLEEAYLLAGATLLQVTPSAWKGQVPKDVHHAKVRRDLTPGEILTVDRDLAAYAPGMRHNAWDAIALNKWYTKWHVR